MDGLRARAWACVAQGLFLAIALVWLQYQRLILVAGLDGLSWGRAFALMAPEAGFALLFEAAWLAVAGSTRPWADRLFRWGFVNSHLALYLLALLDHQSFVIAGARSSSELWVYVLDNAELLDALVVELMTARFVLTLAAVPIWMLLAALLASRPLLAPHPKRALPAALVGLALPWGIWLGGGGAPLEVTSTFVDATLLFPRVRYAADRLRPELAEPLYTAPTVDALGRRPNVLVLILESTRHDRFRDTETFRALDDGGVAFDRAYSSVIHTSKAVVGLLCGMYPRLAMPISEAQPGGLPLRCLPELLGEHGYRSLWIQAALAEFEQRRGLVDNLGFDQGIYGEELLETGTWAETGYFGVDEHAMVQPLVRWLGEDPSTPWLLSVLTVTTHHPFHVPNQAKPTGRGEEPAAYTEALEYVDAFTGQLLAELARVGALDDTLIVVVGDHGEAFGEHGRWYHNNVPYEETVRTPLVVLGPEELVGPPRRDSGLRTHLDVLPTVLDVLDADWDGQLPGKTLLGPGHERVLSACWLTSYCLAEVTDAGRKTIFHYGYKETEVFDLVADPEERENLAGQLSPDELRAEEDRLIATQVSVEQLYADR